MTTTLTEKTFDTGELIINFAEGETDAPPMLLLHGSTLRWQSFSEYMPALERDWHLYACDLRGHGGSGWARSGYRIADFVPDSRAFVEQHIGRPTVLLGFSTGAMITLGVAAQLPDFIRGIIMLDPPLRLRNAGVEEMVRPDGSGPYRWFTWLLETLTTTNTFDEIVARCKQFNPDTDEAGARDQAKFITAIDPESVATVLGDQFLTDFDLQTVLPRIKCPALLVSGEPELGSGAREEDIAFVTAYLPQLISKQVTGTGHEVIWDTPGEQTLEHVMQFLDTEAL